jgi:hypothetical protein
MLKQPVFESAIQRAFRKFLGLPKQFLSKPKQMWNASVSFKTYQQLKRQGVLA